MKRFLDSINIALKASDWYGALSTALTLPDICGSIEQPNLTGKGRYKKRYIDFYNKYLLEKYSHEIGPDRTKMVFLSGQDCWSLRCSYLHAGSDIIRAEEISNTLNRFHFITPPEHNKFIHGNRINNILQLQVDAFCQDMIKAVEKWMNDADKNLYKEGIKNILKIHDSSNGIDIPGFLFMKI